MTNDPKTFRSILTEAGVWNEELERQLLRHMEEVFLAKDHQHQQAIEENEREFVKKGMDFFYQKLDQEFKSFDVIVKLGKILQQAKREYSHSKKDEATTQENK